MIKVYLSNGFDREEPIVDGNTTLRELLTDHHVDLSRGIINLDGVAIRPGDMDKTLSELTGGAEECYCSSIQKADSAC